jgi:hypothetical protein
MLARPFPTLEALRGDEHHGAWMAEHDDCRPPVRVAAADDERIEAYREHYEEA